MLKLQDGLNIWSGGVKIYLLSIKILIVVFATINIVVVIDRSGLLLNRGVTENDCRDEKKLDFT